MNGIRVHACNPDAQGYVAYLVLSWASPHRIEMDFSHLVRPPGDTFERCVMGADSLYSLLCGRSVQVSQGSALLTLGIDGESVHIATFAERWVLTWETHAWLAEFALGWNLLHGRQSS